MNKYATIDKVLYPAQFHPFAAAVKDEEGIKAVGDSYSDIEKTKQETNYFEKIVRNYLKDEGKELINYLQKEGYQLINLEGVGAATLDDAVVAALARYDGSGVLLSNASQEGFKGRIGKFASQYGIFRELAKQYVLDHEIVHAAKVTGEKDVERVLEQYYLSQAEKTENKSEKGNYLKLASIAKERQKESYLANIFPDTPSTHME